MDKNIEISQFQALNFYIQNINICADLQYINRALLLPMLDPVPDGPDCLAGLLNLSGKGIPVIDLSIDMKIKRSESYSLNTIVLICKNNNNQMGIIVDKVMGIESVDKNNFQLANDFDDKNVLFNAIVPIGEKLSLFLDINDLLNSKSMNLISNINHDFINKVK